MIDAHCHLMDFKPLNLGEYKGMEAIVNCGYDLKSSISAVELKKQEPRFTYCVVGISPQKCMDEAGEAQVAKLEELARKNTQLIDGIGEIGLDFHWADTPEKRGWQRKLFKRQIKLAEELTKPIIVHARDATTECIKELDRFKGKVQFHFYSGNEEEAKVIAHKGWLISIPPLKGKGRSRAISAVPIENLTAETDGPYVGKTPLETKSSIEIIAEIKGISFGQAEKTTSENARKLFG